jgi:hypothetical protein
MAFYPPIVSRVGKYLFAQPRKRSQRGQLLAHRNHVDRLNRKGMLAP